MASRPHTKLLSWLVFAEIKCFCCTTRAKTTHTLVPKKRQQAPRAYCPNKNTATKEKRDPESGKKETSVFQVCSHEILIPDEDVKDAVEEGAEKKFLKHNNKSLIPFPVS